MSRGVVALNEPQIQRYARQILLRGFGGKGQHLLCTQAVEVVDDSPVLRIAAAYLVAGGTPVLGLPVGAFAVDSLRGSNPDVDWNAPVAVRLFSNSEAPARSELTAVMRVNEDSIAWSFSGEPAPVRRRPGTAPGPVLIGSLAALIVQRVLLGELTRSGDAVFSVACAVSIELHQTAAR
jgi:hypothetical protein